MKIGGTPKRNPIGPRLIATLTLLLSGCHNLPVYALGTPAPHYRVVGYDVDKAGVDHVDVGKIDTLIFAFARVADDRVVLDPDASTKLHQLTGLKAKHPALKVVLSVGGWGAGGFSEAASTPANRRRFADSATKLLLDNDADGLDVDWEYPGHSESGIHSSPQDRTHLTLLLQSIRTALDAAGQGHGRHYTLSMAVADGPFVDGIDIAAIAPYLDWFNLMTYDVVNSMTQTTGHHSGLHASALAPADARTTDRAVKQFLAAGVPPGKLLIGAAFYGREFDDVKPDHNGLYQAYGHYGSEHPWPQLQSDFINRRGFVRYWDAQAQAPYLWNAATRQFISYDDPQSIAAKAVFVKAQHLGGIMYWEQSEDPQNVLLDAIWRGLQ
ncbi:chitinase [Rhodanobacter sp. ANJX3]|uniref:glycoside hydrolase family 18 protein n=1 Tax=Rhodanobacter sp. ANJX3 TaxID=2723083 RepID=UPI00185AFE39|nr:glycoside hydrolase family 18 protein [Rhodanobacter sp. ANJX3]MBB5358128.1 chitinase [Rhodanobacter sp. ANJX3]